MNLRLICKDPFATASTDTYWKYTATVEFCRLLSKFAAGIFFVKGPNSKYVMVYEKLEDIYVSRPT